MMNLLQRSLRNNEASASANTTNPSASKSQTKPTSTGFVGTSLHHSGPLFQSGYHPDHNYFKSAYDLHYANGGGFYSVGHNNLTAPNLSFNNLDTGGERFINQTNESTCQKKHVHHTHHTHSTSQQQQKQHLSSTSSSYFENYGKLFPPSSLQYLHQHNHLEEILIAQQLFAKLDWIDGQPVTVNYDDKYGNSKNFKQNQFSNNFTNNCKLKAHEFEFEALTKYSYNDKPDDLVNDSYTVPIFMNSKFGSISATHCPLNYEKNITGCSNNSNDFYRISFLETHIYQAQDIFNHSPQHLPHQRGYSQNFLHNEWIRTNLENLRNYFNPQYNEILVNVEKKAKFPFIVFGNPGPKFNNSNLIMPTASSINLSHELRITDGLFEICDYALGTENLMDNYDKEPKRSPLGYIIAAFLTYPGEDNLKLEESWFVWTGAAYLSKTLPASIGLGRLLFFKRRDLHLLKSDCLKQFVDNELPIFTYVLFCELFSLTESDLPSTCAIIDQLRARCCGYTALYINCT